MIPYYLHDHFGRTLQRHAEPREIQFMLAGLREEAEKDRQAAGAAHAVYAVEEHDQETGDLLEVDMFDPAVLVDDDEFRKRTDGEREDHPGCVILATHAKNEEVTK